MEKNSRDIQNTGHWQAAGLQSSVQVRRSLTLAYFCLCVLVGAFGVYHYPRVFSASRDFIKKFYMAVPSTVRKLHGLYGLQRRDPV